MIESSEESEIEHKRVKEILVVTVTSETIYVMMIQWLNQWRHDRKTALSTCGLYISHCSKNILAQDDVFWLCQKSEKHLTRKKIDKSERRDTRFLVKPRNLSFTKVPMHPRSQAVCRDVTV